ncbi:radical SAM protein [Aurantimonas sp. C2-6-R+9]|uniref:radical SAM protein n=1 Tax=unclassified Aurantimonas TaxID=2638230 RepID=UPI002E184276|nr:MULTISPECIES: radical SAM protein [unclassified Aurantimonas]MEC5291700.1 radical SAM protein [Aurantimonas sp. C2-3-R2]MEC5381882.1 radical SAM protein [Aurantimonas sp. C2-6-R+9]MEC5412784.1 radical SAM protein [Aurantimonas sp. C2-4-R8]
MKRFLYHDLIVAGNWCNLKCSYCTSVADAGDFGEATSASAKRRGAAIAIPNVLAMLDGLRRHVDAPVIKVSGGELFLLANAADLVAELSARYAHVQVLTNGTELTPAIVERLSGLGNVGFNLSLDGHTPEMNAMRWRSPRLGERVMTALDAITATGRPLEITMVVSDANAAHLCDFLAFLATLPCRVVLIPIPVRGIHSERLFGLEARRAFAELLRSLPGAFAPVLGPAAYYHRLADFLDDANGIRRHRCHLTAAAVQLFDTGAITPCPVGWTAEIANVRRDGIDAASAVIGEHKLYDLMQRDPPRVPVCRNCFSQADVLNLYLDGAVDLEELAVMPLFSEPAAWQRLVELKTARTRALQAGADARAGFASTVGSGPAGSGAASAMAVAAER